MKISVPPISKFKSKSPAVSQMLEDWIVARLFWTKKVIVINDKGELNFSHHGASYSYQLEDPKKFFQFKNSRVIIHFSPTEMERAYIFNEESRDFISHVGLRPIWTKDKPEILKKHVGMLNRFHAYIKKRGNEDRVLANGENKFDAQSRMDNLTKRLNKKLAKESLITCNENPDKQL